MTENTRPAAASSPASTDGGSADPVLDVRGLSVTMHLPSGPARVVDEVTFSIGKGELLGMVGESGSGKSMTALAITRMLPGYAELAGSVHFDGADLAEADESLLRTVRGGQVGMVFQDPLTSLNPLMTVGWQISETLRLHGVSRAAASRRAVELLDLVGIRSPAAVARLHPHELSGGMRQRVMIAIAVANNPRLVIADEPTTALDVTIQAEILRLLSTLRDEFGTAVLLITHDMSIVNTACDRVVVLYGGRVAEAGPKESVVGRPQHPYTWQLIRSGPRLGAERVRRLATIPGSPPDPSRDLLTGCRFAPRCQFAEPRCHEMVPPLVAGADHLAACWVVNGSGRTLDPQATSLGNVTPGDPAAGQLPLPPGTTGGETGQDVMPVEVSGLVVDYRSARDRRRARGGVAVDGADLAVGPGEVVGLVGESGSGKSTLARAVAGLLKPTAGRVAVEGKDWSTSTSAERRKLRQQVQLVFQDPFAALNPRWTIRRILSEPASNHLVSSPVAPAELLEMVNLPANFLDRYPGQLSGGQCQRVGIARALAVRPRTIVTDEPVSALDVSVQAQVLNLLMDLRDEFSLSLLFVSHDLAVISQMADRVAVMHLGRIVETGPTDAVLGNPHDEYTRRLLSSAQGR